MNTSRWRRHVMWLSVLAIVLAACGDGGAGGEGDGTTVSGGDGGDTTAPAEECTEPDPVRLQLQWFAQSQFAGYYVALDNGFYEAQCLEVEILEGAVEIVPQQVLATGGAEFGIAWVPKALVSREGGADIINIAQVFERSGTLQVSWADSGIETPADWEGKRVGNWGFGNEYEVLAAIEKFDVTVGELVAQDFTMNALLNDEIDAAEAMIYNEYAQVLEAVNPDTGELYQPEDLSVIDYNHESVATAMLQDGLWVTADWIAEEGNEDIATRFLTATFQGWIHCLDNFDECVEVVLNNGSTLGASHQEWQLNEILGLIFPATNGIGVMNEELWDQTISIATEQVVELQGVEIPDDVYRTDLAQAAVDALGDADVSGSSFERRDVELQEGGS